LWNLAVDPVLDKSGTSLTTLTERYFAPTELQNVRCGDVDCLRDAEGNPIMDERGNAIYKDSDGNYFLPDYQTRCMSETDRTRLFSLESSPEVLVIQLGRFAFDPLTLRDRKLRMKVEYEAWIDLSKFQRPKYRGANSLRYRLASVVAHSGTTLRAGHWIAFCTGPTGIVRINDRAVASQRPLKDLLGDSTRGYKDFPPSVLVYVRDRPAPRTGPPRVAVPLTPRQKQQLTNALSNANEAINDLVSEILMADIPQFRMLHERNETVEVGYSLEELPQNTLRKLYNLMMSLQDADYVDTDRSLQESEAATSERKVRPAWRAKCGISDMEKEVVKGLL